MSIKRPASLAMGLFLLATVPQSCGIAALVAAVAYASDDSAEKASEAQMAQARVSWERMNIDREKAGLAPLPFPADVENLTPEQIQSGRQSWGEMNARRAEEGKDPLPLPKAYQAKKGPKKSERKASDADAPKKEEPKKGPKK